ncbi:YndJ family transporter [Streptomyces lavendulocolor]|uniref:YndJ family transporter n=1 Tax=Streptomyces lavendulocolor TaxID=67316 RepID=UPI003F4D47B8
MSVLVGLIVTLGMLVIVPVGLRLVGAPVPAAIRRAWPLLAVPGAELCLWLPRGAPAAALGFALCAMAAWHRLRRSDPADGAGRAGRPRRSLRAPGTREICGA